MKSLYLIIVALLTVAVSQSLGDDPEPKAKNDKKEAAAAGAKSPLRGVWNLMKNEEGAPEVLKDRQFTKFFGEKHWTTTHCNRETGEVMIHTGGTYKIEGDIVSETIVYSLPNTKHLIGETNRFRIKFVDGKLHFEGLDRRWKEIWKRAE
ncbi:MAG: hypothetical protein ACR2RV_04600 [Verrucomicrobiales bacterium]